MESKFIFATNFATLYIVTRGTTNENNSIECFANLSVGKMIAGMNEKGRLNRRIYWGDFICAI